ncbi:hypothetical protein F4805DRAFT_441905 [Annulohypoxylon moriforme]|nr:hypothetical protein F4805DRAFT_441905 [Annulohypoxylon moriforme]
MQHLEDSFGSLEINVVRTKNAGGNSTPNTSSGFLTYPTQQGYDIREDFTIERIKNWPVESDLEYSEFMQNWLFFGLILTTLRISEAEPPFIEVRELLTDNETHLTTGKLPEALDKWEEYQVKHSNGIEYRMAQLECILETARRVVRKNCTVREGPLLYNNYDKNNRRYLSDASALTIMVVGEVLSAAKRRVMENTKADIPGWHADDDTGWGPSNWVSESIASDKDWCPRAVHLLQAQLGKHATLMLAAYYRYDTKTLSERVRGGKHEKCDKSRCKALWHGHMHRCDGKCGEVGPPIESVVKILQTASNEPGMFQVPLVCFRGDTNSPGFEVMSRPPNGKYATISHVWSDGWGNKNKNKLSICRLKFIREQIRCASGTNGQKGDDIPFWMDTLVIPVASRYEDTKRTAISQITDVFESSSFTIVLDHGLIATATGGRPAQEAMNILPSIWMRRLWTLQEGFLSERILFAFQSNGGEERDMIDYDNLDSELNQKTSIKLYQVVRTQLSSYLMGNERAERKHLKRYGRGIGTGSHLIASAWSAARWRTTGNAVHEVLALATLLGLDFRRTKIEEAGVQENTDDTFLDELMCEFWITVEEQFKGSIPPGIIFLPGLKVEKPRDECFGWAPRTWLSAQEIDYPDPLSQSKFPTSLDRKAGLQVQYPGFLLHAQNRGVVLGTIPQTITPLTITSPTITPSGSFSFPVDINFMEWYVVEVADQGISTHIEAFSQSTSPLAIILSRPRPRTSKPEIGLLVEIYKTTESKTRIEPGSTRSSSTLYCQVIHRVRVRREITPKLDIQSFRFGDNGSVIGGALEENQEWYVDGYKEHRSVIRDKHDKPDQDDDPKLDPRKSFENIPASEDIQGSSGVEETGNQPSRNGHKKWYKLIGSAQDFCRKVLHLDSVKSSTPCIEPVNT